MTIDNTNLENQDNFVNERSKKISFNVKLHVLTLVNCEKLKVKIRLEFQEDWLDKEKKRTRAVVGKFCSKKKKNCQHVTLCTNFAGFKNMSSLPMKTFKFRINLPNFEEKFIFMTSKADAQNLHFCIITMQKWPFLLNILAVTLMWCYCATNGQKITFTFQGLLFVCDVLFLG